MTTEEALNVVAKVCSEYKGTLQEHQIFQTAIVTLKTALVGEEPAEETTEDDSDFPTVTNDKPKDKK